MCKVLVFFVCINVSRKSLEKVTALQQGGEGRDKTSDAEGYLKWPAKEGSPTPMGQHSREG